MFFWNLKKSPKNVLGIDIGSSAIKVVELAKYGEQEKLVNYGIAPIEPSSERPVRGSGKEMFLLSSTEISEVLKSILRTARIKGQRVIFAIPDYTTFFTNFVLPPMSKEEIPQAVQFEARRHVPLPLSEVTLDWSVTKGVISDFKKEGLEILLVVVPNETINQYKKIIELCQFELLAIEAEVFGLQRALVKDDKKTLAIIDIGSQSTTCSIVDKKILKLSHSFDIAGNSFTQVLSKSLDLDYKTAELLKEKQGIRPGTQSGKNTHDLLTPLFDLILNEVQKAVETFSQHEGKQIQSYILAGGTARLPGLKEYFEQNLHKEVILANPFAEMVYPPVLEGTLKELGPELAVAVGMAKKGLE